MITMLLNTKRLVFYMIEVCILVELFTAVDSIKRERKKGTQLYVPCPHPQCQCKPGKQGDVIVRCIKVSDRVPEFLQLNVTFAEFNLAKRNLNQLPDWAFRGIRTRILDIGNNPFEEGSISDRAFAGLESDLEVIWLNNCLLKEAPEASLSILTKLKIVHLEENQMTDIRSRFLSSSQQLHELYLDRNSIGSIHLDAFSELTNLKQLKLGQNRIQILPSKLFKPLKNLISLDLSQNFIREVSPGAFDGLKNLRWLELESNRLSTLDNQTFRGASNLRNMKIENNPFTSIADNTFRVINKLGYLSIDIANVSNLTTSTFAGLSRLKTMSLGEVVQPMLPDGFLSSLRKLRRLSLTDNMQAFTGLRKDIFAERFSFRNLSVFVSPLQNCRCSEQWIRSMTTLGAYVHGYCVDSRPLSCTGKVSVKQGSELPRKHTNNDRRKVKAPESTDS